MLMTHLATVPLGIIKISFFALKILILPLALPPVSFSPVATDEAILVLEVESFVFSSPLELLRSKLMLL